MELLCHPSPRSGYVFCLTTAWVIVVNKFASPFHRPHFLSPSLSLSPSLPDCLSICLSLSLSIFLCLSSFSFSFPFFNSHSLSFSLVPFKWDEELAYKWKGNSHYYCIVLIFPTLVFCSGFKHCCQADHMLPI